MSAPPLLLLHDQELTFGGTPLLEGAELSIAPGERLCLVGRNGSGKSTLLKIAAGLIESDSGRRFLQPGTTVRYLPQEPDLSGHDSVLDYVLSGLTDGDDAHGARRLLKHLGLSGDEPPAQLSGGEARRAALARVLAAAPDIALLDEPTNHLDLPAIEWLEGELAVMRTAFVLISHDRRFLERLTRATVWLDRGTTRRVERGFAGFEAWRDETLEAEERDAHKVARKIVREEHWLRYGVTARRKRNQRRLAALHSLREQHRTRRRAQGRVQAGEPEVTGSGKLVIEAKGVHKAWDDKQVVRDVSLRLLRGDRLGLVGPNGSGKTTLVNLLTGALQPDQGTVKIGARVDMVTLDQKREALRPEWTVQDALTGGKSDYVEAGGQRKHIMSYMKDFLFLPEQARTPVGALSGGERGRLMLARALAHPSNLLVLDEPTNDLDLETLDLLQELIADYAGTVLLVSHDRDFLDRVATSILAFDATASASNWIEYAGGYSDMLAQRKGAGSTAAAPTKPKTDTAKPTRGRKPAGKSVPGKSGLSYTEQHRLDALPGEIERLGAEAAKLNTTLATPGLFTKDRTAFDAATQELTRVQAALDAADEEWLALELKREAAEEA